MTKFLGTCVVLFGLISVPFLYMASLNTKQLALNFEDLDNNPSKVFNSVANCVGQGYALVDCESSKKNALSIANDLGTTITYNSRSDCNKNHQACVERTWMMPVTTRVGNTTIVNNIPQTTYDPPIIAWQAVANNLSISVPLYSGPNEREAVRKDGKIIALKQ